MSQKETRISQYFSNDRHEKNSNLNSTLNTSEIVAVANDRKVDPKNHISQVINTVNAQSSDKTASFFDSIGTNSIIDEQPLKWETSLQKGISSMQMAEYIEPDRCCDAWIPSPNTRQYLIACLTNKNINNSLSNEFTTSPEIILKEDLSDPLKDVLTACFGETEASQRSILTADDVTQNGNGLKELIQAGSFRAAINLTTRLLTFTVDGEKHPIKHSPYSLQIWFTRIALLLKIKLTVIAQCEAQPFGQLDKPDMFYQFYPETYKHCGSMASFSFRLLLAELPMHLDQPLESLQHLYKIQATVKQMLQNLRSGACEDGSPVAVSDSQRQQAIQVWEKRETRVLYSIVNCALQMSDNDLAVQTVTQLCQRDGVSKINMYSALGRLHLQVGSIAGGQHCFNTVSEMYESNNMKAELRQLIDKGLVAVAEGNYSDAYNHFHSANATEPSNIMVINNMAVCLLYMGRLKQAIEILEGTISSNPMYALNESLLFNLCTLYDMISSDGQAKRYDLLKKIASIHSDVSTALLEKLKC